jgi:hypothetical protein
MTEEYHGQAMFDPDTLFEPDRSVKFNNYQETLNQVIPDRFRIGAPVGVEPLAPPVIAERNQGRNDVSEKPRRTLSVDLRPIPVKGAKKFLGF